MIKKIKVCHLTSAHPENDIRIFHKQCISLHKADFDVYLVVPNTNEKTSHGVQIKSFQSEKKGRVKRFLNTVNLVYKKAIEIDADIYHFHDPELLRIGLKLAKKGKIVIYDAHEDVPKQIMDKHWIPKILRSLISYLFSKYEAYVSKRISGIVSVTINICNRFKNQNKNVELVANYPLLEEAEKMNILDFKKKEKQICYIGGLFPTRGIAEMIESTKNIDVELALAGTFSPESFKSELENKDGWEKVNYLGHVKREEIMEILKTSKLGLVTLHPTRSYVESLPIKMFEYMSAGLPVIASNFPEWKDIINETNCGICVDPLNPNEIANAIETILSNPLKANLMGENGKEAFYKKYNWLIEEEKLIAFYKKLIQLKSQE